MRKNIVRLLWIAFVLCFSCSVIAADWVAPRVDVDISKAPEVEAYAQKSKALVELWYPRINEILFGVGHPLPFEEIHIIFEPTLNLAIQGVIAYAERNVIHISSRLIKKMPDNFQAMLIHELTHVNQYNTLPDNEGWVVEGIADYVRHKYFEKDIEDKLHVDRRGRLNGYTAGAPYLYSLQNMEVDLRSRGYLQTYTVASTFFFWLESRKNQDIVRKLSLALSTGTYSPKLFEQFFGTSLDALWKEFMMECDTGNGIT